MNEQVKYTGVIPICPYCKKPTIRQSLGYSSTLLAYTPTYNINGKVDNCDPNTTTSYYNCNECGQRFTVRCRMGECSYVN